MVGWCVSVYICDGLSPAAILAGLRYTDHEGGEVVRCPAVWVNVVMLLLLWWWWWLVSGYGVNNYVFSSDAIAPLPAEYPAGAMMNTLCVLASQRSG